MSFSPGCPWTNDDLDMRILQGDPEAGFDCGRADQNDFLHRQAARDARRGVTGTHVLYVKGVLAAYVVLLTDRITLGPQEKPKGVTYRFLGAMKIAQLGVDRRFGGHGLGKFMVGYAIQHARTLRPFLGCRYVTLDSQPDLVAWYEGQGFERNKLDQEYRRVMAAERGKNPEDLPISMRFDLRELGDEDE